MRPWIIALTIFCVLLTTAAQIALKVGVSSTQLQGVLASGGPWAFLRYAIFSPAVLIGVVLYVASMVIWLLVLARADVSYAYPFVSMGFVLTALYAYYALGEPLGPIRIAGIALIVGGVWLVSQS